MNGTRPTDPNAPERPEEKLVTVTVEAPDPQSTAPKTDTVYIYTTDGRKIATQTAPFTKDSGLANWPPDQTPVSLKVTFTLDPGDYIVCDTYVAKQCSAARSTADQKFTKVKYKPLFLSIGTQYQTPDKKRINGHVNYIINAPCGSTISVDPVGVELTGPGGKAYNKQTNAGQATPVPGENGAICTKQVSVGLDVTFDDMPPGTYKACATGAECVTFEKKDGEAASFTLTINADPQAPPDQKVCTSGGGIAGALAWIICPAVQLIASATNFFENNIIIPFMTVSPLTTNGDNPIYIIWQDFRDLANVGFIFFLFISIFSIIFSRYGLKRVLPRLLIVAIGINLSYFVVAFVIDAFNIFGAGVSQLVLAALHQAGTTQLNTGTSAGSVRSIFVLGGAVLLTVILTAGAALGWLFSFIGLAALVIVVVVMVLIARQIAIIVLVMVSPLAILFYLLPNTEAYFKKWRHMLIQLLMMYPMIVLLFASGKIFGVLLQQPDFNIAGDGVSDEVAQSVRVILQFLVYVIPLAFLPATFALSGALMERGIGLLKNARLRGAVQKPGESFREGVVKPKAEELRLRAAQRGGVVGKVAGYGYRKRFKQGQREEELTLARQQYLASLASDEDFAASAAGIGGQPGITRVQGSAVSALERARQQQVANETALFNAELRRLGISTKEFNTKFSGYLDDPRKNVVTGTARDATGNLQTLDLSQRQDITRSALNAAAAAGEITTVERARLSTSVNQDMLDEVIRNNEGSLKGKGGFHLATNFNLAAGRSQGTQRDINIQRLRRSFGASGTDIAGMKASFVADVVRTLRNPTTRNEMFTGPDALTQAERLAIRDAIHTITVNPDIRGGAKNLQGLKDIENSIL